LAAGLDHTRDFERVFAAELDHNALRLDPAIDKANLIGLALSGGGIRSAAFALGVLQSLDNNGVLRRMHYLSSVSGGGYTGAALTWAFHQQRGQPYSFPLGRPGVDSRSVDGPNARLNFIRQRGNYLNPGAGLNLVSAAAVVVRCAASSLAFFMPLLLLGFIVLDNPWFSVFGRASTDLWGGFVSTFQKSWLAVVVDWQSWWPAGLAPLNNLMIAAGLILAALFVVLALVYSLRTAFAIGAAGLSRYDLRLWSERLGGRLGLAVIACAVLGTLPYVFENIGSWATEISAALAGTGALAGYVKFLRDQIPTAPKGGAASGAIFAIGSAALVYGLLLFGYAATRAVFPDRLGVVTEWHGYGVLALCLWLAAFGRLVNLNYVSIHRLYRDRLMEAFLPDREAIDTGDWKRARTADTALLSAMCGPSACGPYHLINCNVVLIDSVKSTFRGRGGDNFILSPLYCGSFATGWRSTRDYLRRANPRRGEGWWSEVLTFASTVRLLPRAARRGRNAGEGDLSLATAMAISGAAANPGAGVSGRGPTRSVAISLLMNLLNLRLGCWAPNPDRDQNLFCYPPNYWYPGLKALFNQRLDESRRYIEITDGGHFDNTGLYELIRRKVRTIVLADASADFDFNFAGLADVMERVRVDFGTDIRFPDDEVDLSHMFPGTGGSGPFPDKYRLSTRGFAVGTIRYADDPGGVERGGVLVYIKPVITKGLPADIYGYRSRNPQFPHQPTSDQFFDETQFEAYRELGYRMMEQFFAACRTSLPQALRRSWQEKVGQLA
jgi:hypothetical protein